MDSELTSWADFMASDAVTVYVNDYALVTVIMDDDTRWAEAFYSLYHATWAVSPEWHDGIWRGEFA